LHGLRRESRPLGVANSAHRLAEIKAPKFASAEYEDVKSTIRGGIAIVTGGFKGNGTDSAGKAFDVLERWRDLWVKAASGQVDVRCIAQVRRSRSIHGLITRRAGPPKGGPSCFSPRQ
jgi:hypothetical protein